MKSFKPSLLFGCLGLACVLNQGCTTSSKPAPGARPPAMPDDVLQTLRRMGDTLRSAKSMRFTSRGFMDEALDSGQLVQIGRRGAYAVRRPDRLYVGFEGDDANWQMWYDGKKLTVLDRATDDFAICQAPDTIDGLLDAAFHEHGLSIPMSDLLYTDTDEGLLKQITAARSLGFDPVGEHTCHHLGFRQDTIDWQLWVDAGDLPLPRQLVITYKLEPGMPQYVGILDDWVLDAELTDAEFVARVPQDKASLTMQEFLGVAEEEGHHDDD